MEPINQDYNLQQSIVSITGLRRGLTSYGDARFTLFLRKVFIKALGYSEDALSCPIIGIVNIGSGFNPCQGQCAPTDRGYNKVVLITGLGQTSNEGWGIGAAIACNLAKQGALIFGGNRSLASAQLIKSLIEDAGGICDVQETNVTDSVSVKALVDACMQRYGRIGILINNVGKSEPGCPATMVEAVWDSQVDLNLKSVYLTCHHVLPIMEKQTTGDSVVNVSSIAGLRYIEKPQVAYSATKAAIMQSTKATAVIYAGKNLKLNTIVPGLIYTPYTQEMAKRYAPGGDEGEYMRKRDGQVPMGRMGDAWDVANAVLFLAADESKYITGQELVIDGGITSSTGRV
ncbi:3-oxoacyl-[acyl-carrier-protein] reductase, putative [Talaromyces marneffei ATCC 18224]|uniref:3-oxoacyl-[acyl-carrier-protein] reductase, putative n=1 Tax=Talaromyces marneffei (strain ATCC 18224 / CBS 334.59 / QM 7333) TaxID=441960 RepID=B6Q9W7_TALMQ|nr:3-oxoacyl-[acyl-carrier-protein] reductase, putative [Talaromyces marneffei ATCC 18224]